MIMTDMTITISRSDKTMEKMLAHVQNPGKSAFTNLFYWSSIKWAIYEKDVKEDVSRLQFHQTSVG